MIRSFLFFINHKHKKMGKIISRKKREKSEQVFEKRTDQQHGKIVFVFFDGIKRDNDDDDDDD